jgi:hypothetical protein
MGTVKTRGANIGLKLCNFETSYLCNYKFIALKEFKNNF